MEIIIRECQIDDFQSIYELNKTSLGYDYPVDLTRLNLKNILQDKQHKVFVAVYCNAVVGYVHANDYDVIYSSHMKNIMGIAVNSEYQRSGIGKSLMKSVEKWAKDTGATGIRLVSGAMRKEAHSFYKAYGFTLVKEQYNFRLEF